jgi:hypothetical protein
MGLNIRENGNLIKLMEKEIWSMLIAINIMEIGMLNKFYKINNNVINEGFKVNKMVKGLIHFLMVVNMMVALLTICLKDLVLWCILISTNIRENLEAGFVTVQVNAITTTVK